MPPDFAFHVLSGYTCRKVLQVLRRGPLSVNEIHLHLKLGSRVSVSQALARLLKAELVSRRREGRNTIYQLHPQQFQELARYFRELERDARRNA